jgi:GABA permease
VRNPLEDEEAAFRFVLGTIAFFAPIVLAAWIATWLGIVALVVATAAVFYRLRRAATSSTRSVAAVEPVAAVQDTRRILVVGNETLLGAQLLEVILRLSEDVPEDVLVACPLGRGSGADGVDAAAERLRLCVEGLRSEGVNARGVVFDGGPLETLEEALRSFTPDEVVVSTRAEGRSGWLDEGVTAAVRARFDGPVTHVTESPP